MAWGVYRNGNSITRINLEDGTKIRETKDDEFDLDFPESIDLNIGTKCDGGCRFCYINASPNGIDADLLSVPFINTLHPYTECAINGNSIDHPQLIPFLEKLKSKNVIANITVNQIHFEAKEDIIKDLVDKDLIKGIGISLRDPTSEFIKRVKKYPNAVLHVINGIFSPEDIEATRDQGLKILILGYKNLGLGVSYKEKNDYLIKARQKYLYDVLETLPNHYKCLSFDNLALEQLDVKRILTPEEWDEIFMGEEGTSSMFIDLVTKKFGISSLALEDEMMPMLNNIRDMFQIVKSKAREM